MGDRNMVDSNAPDPGLLAICLQSLSASCLAMTRNLQDDAYSPPALCLDGRGGARPLDRESLEGWSPEDGPLLG